MGTVKMGTAKFTSNAGDTPEHINHIQKWGRTVGIYSNTSSRFMLCDTLMDYLQEAQILPHLARSIFETNRTFPVVSTLYNVTAIRGMYSIC